ncbi:MAG: hypothetical protein Q9227_008374 [Pyrenula ochraceoflavens]
MTIAVAQERDSLQQQLAAAQEEVEQLRQHSHVKPNTPTWLEARSDRKDTAEYSNSALAQLRHDKLTLQTTVQTLTKKLKDHAELTQLDRDEKKWLKQDLREKDALLSTRASSSATADKLVKEKDGEARCLKLDLQDAVNRQIQDIQGVDEILHRTLPSQQLHKLRRLWERMTKDFQDPQSIFVGETARGSTSAEKLFQASKYGESQLRRLVSLYKQQHDLQNRIDIDKYRLRFDALMERSEQNLHQQFESLNLSANTSLPEENDQRPRARAPRATAGYQAYVEDAPEENEENAIS